METKSELRVRLKSKLKDQGISQESHQKLAHCLLHFLENHFNSFPDMIGAFAPIQDEPQFLDVLGPKESHLAFPIFTGEGTMAFKKSRPGDLIANEDFGTRISCPPEENEEVSPNLILIPGLAFTEKGHRLGRGKGFFDRYLENYSGLKLGLCFELQLESDLPVEEHDQLMDFIITEKRVINCKE